MRGMSALVPLVTLLLAPVAGPAEAQPLSGKLTFTAVQPCRVFDTRAQAAGPLAPGVARAFHVVGATNDFTGQGGQAGGCGIPGYSAGAPRVQAVMFNFVAVGPSGAGNLRAWPSDQGVPNASIINYDALGLLNIANGIALPVSQDAVEGDDLTLRADVAGAHVLADVVGFFTKVEPRKYYQTNTTATGGQALNACASGYHMAALWEIHQPTGLSYDTALGFTRDDSGQGPPTGRFAWIRTGSISSNDIAALPGAANCSAWSTTSGFGTIARLLDDWGAGATTISPWQATTDGCGDDFPVWCVQD
jgi:hypothetical protein